MALYPRAVNEALYLLLFLLLQQNAREKQLKKGKVHIDSWFEGPVRHPREGMVAGSGISSMRQLVTLLLQSRFGRLSPFYTAWDSSLSTGPAHIVQALWESLHRHTQTHVSWMILYLIK